MLLQSYWNHVSPEKIVPAVLCLIKNEHPETIEAVAQCCEGFDMLRTTLEKTRLLWVFLLR